MPTWRIPLSAHVCTTDDAPAIGVADIFLETAPEKHAKAEVLKAKYLALKDGTYRVPRSPMGWLLRTARRRFRTPAARHQLRRFASLRLPTRPSSRKRSPQIAHATTAPAGGCAHMLTPYTVTQGKARFDVLALSTCDAICRAMAQLKHISARKAGAA